MPYDNIIISEQPLFRTISERRQSRKAFVENPVEIRNCFTAVKGESPQSDTACFQFSNDLQDRGAVDTCTFGNCLACPADFYLSQMPAG